MPRESTGDTEPPCVATALTPRFPAEEGGKRLRKVFWGEKREGNSWMFLNHCRHKWRKNC